MEKIFPTVLMALDFCAAVPYAVKGWIVLKGCDRCPTSP